MNIETVNELIASLESAGELSIREQKYLALAKAFKQVTAERDAALNAECVWEKTMMEVCGEDGPASVAAEIRNLRALRDTALQALKSQVEQLAAESVALKEACGGNGSYRNCPACTFSEYIEAPETHATDRIVAGIKADGAKAAGDYLKLEAQHMPVVERLMMQDAAEICYGTAARLREGADK